MKRIASCVASLVAVASIGLAIGDATSTTMSKDDVQATTYQRDGKIVLRRMLYRADDPEKRILRQQILMGETKVAEILEFHDKQQTFNVEPNLPFTVGFVNSPTGGLESVALMDAANRIVEGYETSEGLLVPIAGWRLKQAREMMNGFSDLVDATLSRNESPEQLKARVWWMILKARMTELLHNK